MERKGTEVLFSSKKVLIPPNQGFKAIVSLKKFVDLGNLGILVTFAY